jgi:hypothetical protein
VPVSANYTDGDYMGFWTSGVDVFTPHNFYWDSTGLTFDETYSNWAAGEPNNQGDEDCVDIFPYVDFKWNDQNCDKEQYFICEWRSSCNCNPN